jgi:hypothetical protein
MIFNEIYNINENISNLNIKWTIKKNSHDLKKKYNILSVSYYKLENSFRDHDIYYNRLNK